MTTNAAVNVRISSLPAVLSFYNFLSTHQKHDEIGDLANEVRSDPAAPKTDPRLLSYLSERADAGVLSTAWKSYRRAARR